jgi:hypothetical protein
MVTTNVNIDAIFSRAESLCRQVAPLDLVDTPLYILPQSRLPDYLGGKSICEGYTAMSLDLHLKAFIGSAWRGRGACMVINDTCFSDWMDADEIELTVSAIVLHELAHILERSTNYRDRQGEPPVRIQFEALCIGDAVAREAELEEIACPFLGHELRFIRAALHLRHRADVLGTLVPLYGYCGGNQYGLSHPSRYREALGDEPTRLADMSIRDILNTESPEAFRFLWATDMAHWYSDSSRSLERSFCHGYHEPDRADCQQATGAEGNRLSRPSRADR